MTKSIDRMFAYVAIDKDGEGEGIAAYFSPGQGWLPMVGADEARMESMKPIAQKLANAGQQRIALVRFEDRKDLEYIEPNPDGTKGNTIIVNPGGT